MHLPIPRTERSESPSQGGLRIAVWGPAGSGKTTYIAALFGACLAPDARWSARPNDVQTADFVLDHLVRLRQQGNFPEAGHPGVEPATYSFSFHPRPFQLANTEESAATFRSSMADYAKWIVANDVTIPTRVEGPDLLISFTDMSGEQYFSEDLASRTWDYMWKCDGLLCLLDPTKADEHFKIIMALAHRLWFRSKETSSRLVDHMLPHYLAICFTKIDKADFARYRYKPNDLVADLSNKVGVDLYHLLRSYFKPDRIKFFCLSAIGIDENGQSLVQGDRIIAPDKIRPINMLAPLRWLFE